MSNMFDADIKGHLQCSTYHGVDVVPLKLKDVTSTVGEMRIKRPMNAFMLWSTEQRKKLHLEFPKMRHSEISKRLGAEWKLLTDGQKKLFVEESKRLRVVHQNDYPDYKYKPKRKPKKEHCSPLPSISNTLDEIPSAGNGQVTDTFTYVNGWPNGTYTQMQEQFGYMQYPGTNGLIQQMHRYDMNSLQYGHLMPSHQAYMNAAYSYNPSPVYNQSISTAMSLGTVEPREKGYPKSSLVPHTERACLEELRDMTMYMPLGDDARKQYFLQNNS